MSVCDDTVASRSYMLWMIHGWPKANTTAVSVLSLLLASLLLHYESWQGKGLPSANKNGVLGTDVIYV